ncbi:MAG: ATP-binding protein [Gammaproteobacteria bacterium]|nr:ATP-binding protein [Gammaproteobacteria bacterium]
MKSSSEPGTPTKYFAKVGLGSAQLAAAFVAVFLIASIAYGTLYLLGQYYRANLQGSLQTVINNIDSALTIWRHENQLVARGYADDPEVVNLVKQLVDIAPDKATLISSPAQQQLRDYFKAQLISGQYKGFFVINKDNISLASSRDSNVGTQNLLIRQPDILQNAWQGVTLVSRVMRSDVPLKQENSQHGHPHVETLFVVAPIRDDGGEVVALLTLRFNPYAGLFPLLRRGGIGVSGETYMFDREGLMLTNSRFEKQLQQAGLINYHQHSALNIRLNEPPQLSDTGSSKQLTYVIRQAIKSNTGYNLEGYLNYRGLHVIGYWIWDDLLGTGIAIEQSRDEAYEIYDIVRLLIYAGSALASLVIVALAIVFSRGKREVNEAETRLNAVFDTALDGIVIINNKGIIEKVNPIMKELFGYELSTLVGSNVSMLMPEPDRTQHNGYISGYMQTGDAKIIGKGRNVIARRADGTTFPIGLSISRLDLDTGLKFAGIIHDTTQQHLNEENLQKSILKAENASRAKDSFLATMSHEIRTPLTGMLGMLEVLSLSGLSDKQLPTLNTAWESARNLLRIVNDILDWSKIEEGKLSLSLQSTSVASVISNVIDTYTSIASSKDIVINSSVDPRINKAHIFDSLRVAQILNNFVSNAIKFTSHGEITVKADYLSAEESGEVIRFSVSDNGIGIPVDVQKKIFNQYQQGSDDTQRLYGGTGLGLSICRRLAELMDAKVGVESEEGEGSTFYLTMLLPVSASSDEQELHALHPEVKQKAVSPIYRTDAESPLILAVDDHPLNRELLGNQFRLLGLRYEIASNGREALEKWLEGDFAMVLTDCHMPVMDGYEFTTELRRAERIRGAKPTPVVAWTANALVDAVKQCEDAGMDDVLVKPAQLIQLKEMMMKWLPAPDSSASDAPAADDYVTDDKENDGDSAVIDYSVLDLYVQGDDEKTKILEDFLSHINRDKTDLYEQITLGDTDTVASIAHRMKGSCGMVGAINLAKICELIEHSAANNDLLGIEEGWRRLEPAIEELLAQLVSKSSQRN